MWSMQIHATGFTVKTSRKWVPERMNPAPRTTTRLQNRYLMTGPRKIASGRQSRQTGAHNDNAGRGLIGAAFG